MSEIVKPRIFIITEVLNIFEKSYSELESIKQNIVNSSIQESWFQKSIYIHIYTVFETTLYQTYCKILTAFPDTLKNQEIKDIGDILSSFSLTTPLVEIAATAFARNFAYGKIEELLKQYNNIVKIGLNITTCDFLEELKQYKDERNILVHNGILPVEINKDKILNKIECKPPVNHVFSATPSISIFVPKNKIYDDTRRSCRNYYVLQGTQSNL